MKPNLLSLLLGVAVIVTAFSGMTAHAQVNPLIETAPAPTGMPLTPKQGAQLEQFQAQLAQVRSQLTPEQYDQFLLALESGQGLQAALRSAKRSTSQPTSANAAGRSPLLTAAPEPANR